MISVNGDKLELGHFPDGTLLMKYEDWKMYQRIRWQYESDEELFALVCIVKHLRRVIPKVMIDLDLFYVPHARMDRIKTASDVFTLKYFSEIINSLFFHKIKVLDVHSHVAEALIDRMEIIQPTDYIQEVLDKNKEINLIYYPDAGASKKYSDMINLPYCYGIKNRDWNTGKILDLSIQGTTDMINDSNILIIDDIVAYGGSILYGSRKLKEMGCKNIYAFASHFENSILDGELINSGLVERYFTTDSLFTGSHDLIEVIKLN